MVQAPFPAVLDPAYGHREGMGIYLRHHFARYVAESHARRVRDGKAGALIAAAAVAYLLKGIVLAPVAILSRKQRMRCLKSLLKTAGYTRSLFGPGKAEPYRDVSGF